MCEHTEQLTDAVTKTTIHHDDGGVEIRFSHT